MYFVQKGNENFSLEGEHDFLVADKSGKNVLALIEKTIDLLLSAKSETLTLRIK